ncbi:MAG TPA: MOSC domain-containing protein [Acidimicrobiales bacterium]|nr:MOSC domain-containing protein [Acidimicrobiales bacterium]
MPDLHAQIAGVFVGRPTVIGEVRGRPVESAIAKQRSTAPTLALSATNLAGDRQADLSVHGGPDKAVYAYPAVHYPAWRADGFAAEVGGFGENVTLDGVDEHAVLVGDVWQWGDALLQVSQPRAPCFKLALHAGRKDVGPRMIATGRCGWYFRVVREGTVPTAGALDLVDRLAAAPSIAETFAALFGVAGAGVDRAVAGRVLASPALADSWREPLLARRARSA